MQLKHILKLTASYFFLAALLFSCSKADNSEYTNNQMDIYKYAKTKGFITSTSTSTKLITATSNIQAKQFIDEIYATKPTSFNSISTEPNAESLARPLLDSLQQIANIKKKSTIHPSSLMSLATSSEAEGGGSNPQNNTISSGPVPKNGYSYASTPTFVPVNGIGQVQVGWPNISVNIAYNRNSISNITDYQISSYTTGTFLNNGEFKMISYGVNPSGKALSVMMSGTLSSGFNLGGQSLGTTINVTITIVVNPDGSIYGTCKM